MKKHFSKRLTLIFYILSITSTFSFNSSNFKESPFFIENKGQWDSQVKYLDQSKNTNAWILNSGNILFDFYRIEETNQEEKVNSKFESTSGIIKGNRILFEWQGSSSVQLYSSNKTETYHNYFIGNDTSKYATNVGLFSEVLGKELYQGINIKYYFDNNNIRYDLIVSPNADVNQINLSIKGANEIKIDAFGNIAIETSIGIVKMKDLYVYELETKKQITCKWVLSNNNVLKLEIGKYDKSKTLIIDPLVYSTYLGGTVNDISRGIKVDKYGRAYIAGEAMLNFDLTVGAYQTTYGGGGSDAFVSKINSAGSALIFSTYLGGNGLDAGHSIDIDTLGNIYIAGETSSLNFPVSAGAVQPAFMGSSMNGFITKINAAGNSIIYSTYLGGSTTNRIYGIAIDKQKNAYVTGVTTSSNFPITAGAFQTTLSGSQDAFITKINTTGTSLIYSTYVGGSSDEFAYGIDVDNQQYAYIIGHTLSTDYDITTGALQNTHAGGVYDCFLTKINVSGNALVYSTYLGGIYADYAKCIVVDDKANAYVGGFTGGSGFPISSSSFQTTQNGSGDGFVIKIDSLGTSVVFSTFIGGFGLDEVLGICLDKFYNVYVSGRTIAADFPLSANAYQNTLSNFGYQDVFVSKISPFGTNLYYSSYFGGGDEDISYGIAVDNIGDIYFTGETKSLDYDLTPSPIQNVNQGSRNVFVTKLNICPTILSNISTVSPTCYNASDGYIYVNPSGGLSPYSYSWNDGNSNDTLFNPASGNYSIVITDLNGCSIIDSINVPLQTPLVVSISGPSVICNGLNTTFNASSSNPTVTYQWQINGNNVGSNNPNYSYLAANGDTVVCIVYSSPTCFAISNQIIVSTTPTLTPTISITADTTDSICSGTSVVFTASITNGGTTPFYQWQINGVNVGSNSNTFSTSILSNGDIVTCILTSNYPCVTSNNIASNSLVFYVTLSVTASVNITSNSSIICIGDTVFFTANSTNQGSNPIYQWQINGSNVGSNSSVFSSNNLSNGDVVSVILYSNAACLINSAANSNQITIIVNPCLPPVSSFTVSNTQLCVNSCVNFSDNSLNNPTSWNWQFSGATPASSNIQNPTNICYPLAGIYNVSLIVANAYGADTLTFSNYISVVNSIPVTISGNTNMGICDKTELSAFPTTGTYLWGPDQFLTCKTCQTATVNPNHTQAYWVTYTSPQGCVASDTIIINVDETKTYFMPTGLSPNGDGINDSAHFHGIGVDKFNLKIYDRIGEKVFETTDMSLGWDGTYLGSAMNNGVFVYLLEIYFCDGEYKKEYGNITIVK